jgi:hypothetical protein
VCTVCKRRFTTCLENVDPVSASRLAANYTDETGEVRFDRSTSTRPPPQLGLPLSDDE